VACDDKWEDVQKELADVCTASPIGNAMLGFALHQLAGKTMTDKVYELVGLLADEAIITQELIDAKREDFVQHCRTSGQDATAPMKEKDRIVLYRSTKVPVPCHSLVDEFNMNIAALLKSVATQGGQIAALWCENDLVDAHFVERFRERQWPTPFLLSFRTLVRLLWP
jgi:hypothetical protein